MLRRTGRLHAEVLCTAVQRGAVEDALAHLSDSAASPPTKTKAAGKRQGKPGDVEVVHVDSVAWRMLLTGAARRKTDAQKDSEVSRLIRIAENAAEFRERWGVQHMVGIDEAGRGCWAGAVSVAAVSVPLSLIVEGVTDSKVLSEKAKRGILASLIAHEDVTIAVSLGMPEHIDNSNILDATRNCMQECMRLVGSSGNGFSSDNTGVILDGTSLLDRQRVRGHRSLAGFCATEVEKGDLHHHNVAAASVVAKTMRDATMVPLMKAYPEFSFTKHKAYGTKQHQEELRAHGPIEGVHRRSFRPMKTMGNWRTAAA